MKRTAINWTCYVTILQCFALSQCSFVCVEHNHIPGSLALMPRSARSSVGGLSVSKIWDECKVGREEEKNVHCAKKKKVTDNLQCSSVHPRWVASVVRDVMAFS